MFLVRILANAIIMALEMAAVCGVAYLAFISPIIFAAVTAAAALLLGLRLEQARLANELGFYFGKSRTALSVLGTGVALGEATVKAVLAGVVALLAFSGTDRQRLMVVAVVFGVCVFAGSSILRRLRISLDAVPSRWGYFRLAPPLGLLYSAALAYLPVPSLTSLVGKLTLDLPARPTLAQASEILFLLKQKFDELIVTMLTVLFGRSDIAQIAGILFSVNMLTGFVISIYAVIIAEMVCALEESMG
jgi:hypothetical protein